LLQDNEEDDDLDRSYILATVELHVQQALDDLDLMAAEKQLLARFKQDKDITVEDALVPPMAKDGPLMNKQGKLLRPFVITSKRAQLQAQVFQPHWRLPTMSIDEYLEIERQRGNIISGGGVIPDKQEVDQDDEAAVDAQTYKDRNWDAFKDDNPRGSGNRGGNKG
jgi:hypothetical protein